MQNTQCQTKIVSDTVSVLQEISQNSPQKIAEKPQQEISIRTHDIIVCNKDIIDFGQCLPGTVHESQIILSMPYPLQVILLNLKVWCLNEQLNDLSEYVFAIRKQKSAQYVDECKIKIFQNAPVRVVIGVKTPSIILKKIEGCLIIDINGIKLYPIVVKLEFSTKVPVLTCMKQLKAHDDNRIIKIMMKKKCKKQARIPFKYHQNTKLVVQTQILSYQREPIVQAAPKNFIINPKAQFFITILVRMDQVLKKQIETCDGNFKIRKILLMRIQSTSVYYHFPIEITFYQGQKPVAVE